ncbi:MAG: phage late control D family protein [Synergistaceae bacterium]|nr:phage late control D family protein [Synergistaceae bacterium]
MDTYAPIFIVQIGGRELPRDISEHITSFSYEDNEDKMDELRVVIADMDIAFVDDGQLQEGKEISARWGYAGGAMSRQRVCTIKEIRYRFDQDGAVRLDVSALDARHKLTGRSSRKCWDDKNLEHVITSIAGKHNLSAEVVFPYGDPMREFISQGGKSDYEFLSELADDMGCSFWVDGVEQKLYFKPHELGAPKIKLRYREDRDGYLLAFNVTAKAEERKGTGRLSEASGIDPMKKEPYKQEARSPVTINLGDKREKRETPVKGVDTGRTIPTPEKAGIANVEVQGKVLSASMGVVEGTAKTLGLPFIEAKDCIMLENVGGKFSGRWRVKRVRHEISRSGYTCDLSIAMWDDHAAATSSTVGAPPKAQGGDTARGASGAKRSVPPPVAVDLR